MRGLAVVIVLMSHCEVFGMAGQGSLGVLIFFMLSGFVLTLPLIDNPVAIYSRKFLVRYAVNRFLRIYPAFFAAVMVILFHGPWPTSWIVRNLTFQAGWNHFWSATEEVRFYVLFPFVMMVVFFFSRLRIRVAILLTMILFARLVQYAAPVDIMDRRTARLYFWYFLSGALVAPVREKSASLAMPNPIARTALGFTAGTVLVFAFMSSDIAVAAIWKPIFHDVPNSINGWELPELRCALIAALLFSLSVYPDSFAGRCFGSWPMRHLGLLSYGIYLFHIPVLAWLHRSGFRRANFLFWFRCSLVR